MKNAALLRFAAPVACAVTVGALAGPIGTASASDASIRAVIKSYTSKILVAEGDVVVALGEYKKSGTPTGVETALTSSTEVLQSLKAAIATQTAASAKVKLGKAGVEQGLTAVIHGYRQLNLSISEKSAHPANAKTEAAKALLTINRGSKELDAGIKLLR